MKQNYILFLFSLFFLSCKEYSVDFIIDNNSRDILKVYSAKHKLKPDTSIFSNDTKLILYTETGSGSGENYIEDLERLEMFDSIHIFNAADQKFKKDPLQLKSWHYYEMGKYVEVVLDVRDEDFE